MASKVRKQGWQRSSFSPYQFNHIADFGTSNTIEDEYTGDSTPAFKKLARLHFARRNQTIADRYQAAGTTYEDTTMIAIRHNRTLSAVKPLYVSYNDMLYSVISYSVNDDTYNSYDLLTLKHIDMIV